MSELKQKRNLNTKHFQKDDGLETEEAYLRTKKVVVKEDTTTQE